MDSWQRKSNERGGGKGQAVVLEELVNGLTRKKFRRRFEGKAFNTEMRVKKLGRRLRVT